MKNKVLLINNGYPNYKNKNYCTYIQSIKECLEECENVDFVDIFTLDLEKNKISGYIDFYIRILKLDIDKYDILYINHWSDMFYPFMFKNIKNKKVIINYHGSDLISESKIKNFNNNIGLKLIPKDAKVVVPSGYFKKIISKKITNNISIIPSGGVNTEVFYKYKEITKDDIKIKIGFCSGLTYGKGYDIVMRLISYVEKLNMNIEFSIIDYGDKRNIFKKYIKEHDFNKYVKYYDVIEKEKMVDFYNEIDYLIFPTRRKAESLGLVSLESMACGTPVIGTNNFAIPEYVKDNINGFLIDIENIQGILEKVKQLSDSSNYYDILSEAAINEVKNRYSKEICKISYFNLIDNF